MVGFFIVMLAFGAGVLVSLLFWGCWMSLIFDQECEFNLPQYVSHLMPPYPTPNKKKLSKIQKVGPEYQLQIRVYNSYKKGQGYNMI